MFSLEKREPRGKAAELVQDTLVEQAKAQEGALQNAQDELRATMESSVDGRIKSVNDEVRAVQQKLHVKDAVQHASVSSCCNRRHRETFFVQFLRW